MKWAFPEIKWRVLNNIHSAPLHRSGSMWGSREDAALLRLVKRIYAVSLAIWKIGRSCSSQCIAQVNTNSYSGVGVNNTKCDQNMPKDLAGHTPLAVQCSPCCWEMGFVHESQKKHKLRRAEAFWGSAFTMRSESHFQSRYSAHGPQMWLESHWWSAAQIAAHT